MTEFVFMAFESISWPAALVIGFFLLFLHGTVLTPPSEVSLTAIGLYATLHQWLFFPALITTSAGNIIGCVVLFAVSRRYSDEITDYIASSRFRYVKYLVDKANSDFQAHGKLLVLYGRLIPNIRSAISMPAGISNMSFMPFIIYTGIGCLIWAAIWVSIGYFAGQALLEIIETHKTISLAILILIIGAAVGHRYYIIHWRADGKNI